MSDPEPFIFDTEFGIPSQTSHTVNPAKRKFYHVEEVENMIDTARKEGENSVLAHAAQSMAAQLKPVCPYLKEQAETLRREAVELAMVAARKVADIALNEYGEGVVESALEQISPMLRDIPGIELGVAPSHRASIEAFLKHQVQTDFMNLSEDPTLLPGDWRIKWAEGEIAIDREATFQKIQTLIEDKLDTPIKEEQPDLFEGCAA